jgi:aldose 1-epimerase
MRTFTAADLESEALESTVGGHTTRIDVLPRMGANLVSFRVDGREFMHFDRDRLMATEPHMTGCFHMFPTPCRLTDSRYTFEGKEIVQRKRGEIINIHGVIRDEEFAISKSDRELTATLDFDEKHPIHEGFPFPGRVTIKYTVVPRGIEIAFAYENRGKRNAPVGYGIHPFWLIPGNRADVSVKVPADYTLEQDDPVSQLPTGGLIPVAGTKYDLRDYVPLTNLFIDDVFYPRHPGADAEVASPKDGLRMNLEASDNMKHMICYSPEGRPFVCVENLTCTPDAPNVYAKGFTDLSGLTVVPPEGKLEARVRYVVETSLHPQGTHGLDRNCG